MRTSRHLFILALVGASVGCESADTTATPSCGYLDSSGNTLYITADTQQAADDACQDAAHANSENGTGTVVVDTTDDDDTGDSTPAIDTTMSIVDLAPLGGTFAHKLGVSLNITKFNPASTDVCYVGYNAAGGTKDWSPENCVMYVDLTVVVNGENEYAVVEFDESTQPYLGNLIDAGNDNCWDEGNEYYKTDSCWASIWMVGGDEFTAWVGTDGNVGDYEISVRSTDEGLESGPDNGI